jgi:4-amino-4-deoxy-L-arabinose transferase-like glycosyltransferase
MGWLMGAMPAALSGIAGWRWRAATLLGLVLLAHLALVAPLNIAWRGAAALLLLGLPGFLAALLLFPEERDLPDRAFLGLCGAITLDALLLLVLHILPGPLPRWLVLGPFDTLSLLFGWLLVRQAARDTSARPRPLRHFLPLLLVLLLSAGLRLPFLGGAELQGDEASVVLLGVDAVIGHEEILLLHRKGPVEVLLPTGVLAILGGIDEWAARLPFALAGLGVILGAYVVGRRLFGGALGMLAGLAAALILALDGFLIAYSRMVQYQNVVVLMMLGAVWCGWRFYTGAEQPRRYLICGAVLAAVAGLAHYDGWAVLPALAWLALAGARRRGWNAAQWLAGLGAPLAVFAGLLASFYIPFVRHEHFQTTLRNLMKRTGQRVNIVELFNNLPFYEKVATFYNTTYQIHWLGAALALAMLVWLWRYGRPRLLGVGLAGLLLIGCALLLWAPERFVLVGGNWAILAFGLPLAGLLLSPATPPPLRALLIWFAAPFMAESFLIDDPKTHFYTMDAAAALLIGAAIAQLAVWLRARRLRWAWAPLALAGAALVGLAVPYLYLVFIRQSPEYRIIFPAARPDIYRASYGDTLPRDAGYFGFPHRAGWKVIGQLYRDGTLQGDFESNEDYLITLWYLGRQPRCGQAPAYYFLSSAPIDLVKLPVEQIKQTYHLLGTTRLDGAGQIEIYSRAPVAGSPRTFELRDYAPLFDERQVIDLAVRPLLFELAPLPGASGRWQNGATLERADMRSVQMVAGQSTTLTLNWRADAPLDAADQAVVALVDEQGRTVADVVRLCQSGSPAEWRPDRSSTTSFTIAADATIPPGRYTLQVGIRQAGSGALAPLSEGGSMLAVGSLTVTQK